MDGISYGAILYRDWRWRRQYVCCIFKSLALSSRASLSFNCRPFSDDDDDFPVLWANQTQAFFPVVQAKLCSLFFWSNNSHTWAMLTYSSLVLLDLHVAWCHHQGLQGPRFSRVETEASTQLRVMSTVLLTRVALSLPTSVQFRNLEFKGGFHQSLRYLISLKTSHKFRETQHHPCM